MPFDRLVKSLKTLSLLGLSEQQGKLEALIILLRIHWFLLLFAGLVAA